MAAVFVHDGSSIDYTPGAAVAAGDVVVQGDLVGVAKLDIPANVLGALAVTGVFDFPKATGGGYGDRRRRQRLLGRGRRGGQDRQRDGGQQADRQDDGRGRRRRHDGPRAAEPVRSTVADCSKKAPSGWRTSGSTH